MFDQYPTPFPREEQPAFDQVIQTWFRGFSKSPEFGLLDKEEKKNAETILYDLTGFMLYYQDCMPSEWTKDSIEHCVMIDFPRSLFRDNEYTFYIPKVLILFFRYLDNSNLLSGADDISKKIEKQQDKFYKEMDDTDNYSMRKSLLVASENYGIDTDDDAAVLAYFKQIGDQEMDGIDPEVTNSTYFILSSWVLPFSDSRYISLIDSVSADMVTKIITTLIGFIIEEKGDPNEWKASDLVGTINKILMFPHMEQKMKNNYIPVIHAFFTFLAENNFQPHAEEIAKAILSLQNRKVFSESTGDESMEKIADELLQKMMLAGVDINNEVEIEEFIKENKTGIMLDLISSENPEFKDMIERLSLNSKETRSPPVKNQVDIKRIPKDRRERYESIVSQINQFCSERLDEDYASICQQVAGRLARKKDCQMLRGKSSIWAAGIIYAVGQVNFLFDSSFEPYQSADDICRFFDTSKSTTSQKAKLIRDTIGMNNYWDPEFSTERMKKSNPFNNFRVTKKGFII